MLMVSLIKMFVNVVLTKLDSQFKEVASLIKISLGLLPIGDSLPFLVGNAGGAKTEQLLINAVATNAKQAAQALFGTLVHMHAGVAIVQCLQIIIRRRRFGLKKHWN